MSDINNADYLRNLVLWLNARPEFMNDGKSIATLVNEYRTHTQNSPAPEKKIKYLRLAVRKDLLDNGLSVPVGKGYYGSKKRLKTRWVTEDFFQVNLNGEWLEANCIDWE